MWCPRIPGPVLVFVCVFGAVAPSGAQPTASGTRQVPVESLIYDLKNPDPVRRRDAVTQLGLNKVQRATPDLVAVAGDPDVSVRRALVSALAQVEDIRALPGFVTLSADPERDIRDKAIEGLTSLYLPQESGLVVTLNRVANFFNPWSDEWADVVVERDLKVDPSAITAMTARLQDADAGLRAKAARSLGILRGHAATPDLLAVLREDRSDTARFEAVRALRKIGDPQAGADLLPLITINAPRVRNEVVYALGRLRYAPAVGELARLLDKELAAAPRETDRTYALQLLGALAFIGSPDAKPVFERLRGHPDSEFRRLAFEGLARLGHEATADEVTAIARDRLTEKDGRVRLAQDFALYRMGRKEHLVELVGALGSGRTNTLAREYLLDLHADEVPDLYSYLSGSDVNVLEALVEILGLVGDETALPHLRGLVGDTRGQVSALASQAIRRIRARTAGTVGP